MYINCFVSFCRSGVGRTGYVAVIECSSVQEARPSCSTSGGQSAGGRRSEVSSAGGAVVDIEAGVLIFCFVMDAHEAKEVQLRHGFPSGPKTTPLGNLLGGSSA